jgi:hypothetical protein
MPKSTFQRHALKWRLDVAAHAYTAAEVYLLLLYNPEQVAEIVLKLKSAPINHLKGHDIFSASGLSRFEGNNAHVERNQIKIHNNIALAPLLLICDESKGKMFIVNGYHRLCALSLLDEDVWIKCKVSRFKGARHDKSFSCDTSRRECSHSMQ